jgi:hypothetical protein
MDRYVTLTPEAVDTFRLIVASNTRITDETRAYAKRILEGTPGVATLDDLLSRVGACSCNSEASGLQIGRVWSWDAVQ